MDLTELTDAVVVKTNRPDKVLAIQQAIQEATLWAHFYDLWRRDIFEATIARPNLTEADYWGNVSLTELQGFRKISYWRKMGTATDFSTLGAYLNFVEPDKMFDAFNSQKLDVYYFAGDALRFHSSTLDHFYLIGFWRKPFVALDNYESWIAEYYPFTIINYAAGIIFDDVGQVEVGNQKRKLAALAMEELKVNEIEAVGR